MSDPDFLLSLNIIEKHWHHDVEELQGRCQPNTAQKGVFSAKGVEEWRNLSMRRFKLDDVF